MDQQTDSFSSAPSGRQSSPGKRNGKRALYGVWILVPLIVALVLLFLMVSRIIEKKRLQTIDASAKKEVVLPVKVIPVVTTDMMRYVRHSCVVQAWQRAVILSEVAGKVQSITAKVGDVLEPGSPILKIDDEVLRYTVEQARAKVLQLEANHETSRRDLGRKKSLLKNKVISAYEFDMASAKEKADRALLASAKASLKMARRDLRETSITSPIRGILAERNVDIGTNISRGTQVATVVNIEQVKINVGISEKTLAEIKEGQVVHIETDAFAGRVYRGTVYSVGTKADDVTLSFPVEIVVKNDQQPLLKPGMVARAAIRIGDYVDVISLPQEAVMDNDGDSFVWVVDNTTAHKVFITPVDLVGSNIIIRNELSAGLRVVVSGHERLFQGCTVKVVADSPSNDSGVNAHKQAVSP